MTEDADNSLKAVLNYKTPLKRTGLVLTIGVGGGTAALVIWLSVLLDTATHKEVVQAAQMVLQFNSFLAGGWVVGFFFFWGALARNSGG